MDGVLNNALQRISLLERIAVNNTSAQLDTEHASSSRSIDSDGLPNRYHSKRYNLYKHRVVLAWLIVILAQQK